MEHGQKIRRCEPISSRPSISWLRTPPSKARCRSATSFWGSLRAARMFGLQRSWIPWRDRVWWCRRSGTRPLRTGRGALMSWPRRSRRRWMTRPCRLSTPPDVRDHVQRYVAEHGQLTFSVLTYHEVMRGLLWKGRRREALAFDQLARESQVLPLDLQNGRSVWGKAMEMWATLARDGDKMGEVDLLIAATAATHGLVVATSDHRFEAAGRWVDVEDWRLPPQES